MLNFEQPSVVLRQAWSQTRLDAIQRAVQNTILELQLMADSATSSFDDSTPNIEHSDADRQAFADCCAELREESGLSRDPPEARSERPDAEPGYLAHLDRYRRVAAQSLCAALGPFAVNDVVVDSV